MLLNGVCFLIHYFFKLNPVSVVFFVYLHLFKSCFIPQKKSFYWLLFLFCMFLLRISSNDLSINKLAKKNNNSLSFLWNVTSCHHKNKYGFESLSINYFVLKDLNLANHWYAYCLKNESTNNWIRIVWNRFKTKKWLTNKSRQTQSGCDTFNWSQQNQNQGSRSSSMNWGETEDSERYLLTESCSDLRFCQSPQSRKFFPNWLALAFICAFSLKNK